jgi:hypothetical protein
MWLKGSRHKQALPGINVIISFWLLSGVFACGQTASDLSAKYRDLNAFAVRPGILMTAKYAANGQVCEMTLQRYYSPDQPDADSTIPAKLETELIDELAPAAVRGPSTSKWLLNSFTAGGVSHIERDFVNALVVIDGTYWCTEEADGKTNCGHGGTKVITIQWKNRTCTGAKQTGSDKPVPARNPGFSREGNRGQAS